jgi:hypothetical protein
MSGGVVVVGIAMLGVSGATLVLLCLTVAGLMVYGLGYG